MAINETAIAIVSRFANILNIATYVVAGAVGIYIISIIMDFIKITETREDCQGIQKRSKEDTQKN